MLVSAPTPAPGPELDPPPGPQPTGLDKAWAWVRTAKGAGVTLAAALLVWAGWMLLWDKVPAVCRDQLATTDAGSDSPADLVLRVCEPMTVTDPRALLFLVVVLLLLAPWFSEIEVAGLFRVKKQIAEAEKDVAVVRDSVHTIHSQVATLTATLSTAAAAAAIAQQTQSTNVQVNVNEREKDSAEAQQAVASGSTTVPTTTGAYAQAAFTAGLDGLESLLVFRAPTAMLFYTWGEDELELSQTIGPTLNPLDLNDIHNTVNTAPRWQNAGAVGGLLVITSAAFDDDESIVGAVAVAFADVDLDDYTSSEEVRGLVADVHNMAQAYARLLVDLLGETGRLGPSTNGSERGQ
jgi:hypothetical protein